MHMIMSKPEYCSMQILCDGTGTCKEGPCRLSKGTEINVECFGNFQLQFGQASTGSQGPRMSSFAEGAGSCIDMSHAAQKDALECHTVFCFVDR